MEESLIGMGVTIVVLTFWLALVAVYLAPSLIAWRKQLPATPWFVAVNVLAGWTIVVWCILLTEAVRSRPSKSGLSSPGT